VYVKEWVDPSWLNPPLDKDGYIYLLAGREDGTGYYKIGRTKNPDSRIRQLGILLPYPVELEHLIPCENTRSAEKALHNAFAPRRTNGEWFILTEGDVEDIKRIKAMRGADIEYSS